MNSYVDIDGIPMAANADYLTGVLRERARLRRGGRRRLLRRSPSCRSCRPLRPTAARPPRSRSVAGIDVELPAGDAYLEPLAEQVRSRRRRRGLRRPRRAAGARPEGVARAARPGGLRRRAAGRDRPRLAPRPGARPPARGRSRWCCSPTTGCCRCRSVTGAPARIAVDRPQRRPRRGPAGLLLLRQPRPRGLPRVPGRDRDPHGATRRWRRRCCVRRPDRGGAGAGLHGRGRRPLRLRRRRRGCRGVRRRRGGGRRPGRALRPRHRRGGQRHRHAGPARGAARTGRGRGRHRDPRRAGAADRASLRHRLGAGRDARAPGRRAAGVLPRRGRRARDRRHPHRRGEPVRPAPGHAAPLRRRAALLLPAARSSADRPT